MTYQNCDGIEFLKSLPDHSIDGIFTDPPWGKGPAIQGQENWRELITAMTDECPRILKRGGRVLIWVGMRMFADCAKAVTALEYKWSFFVYYIPARYIACFESNMDPILFFGLAEDGYPQFPHFIRTLYQKVSNGKKDTLHPCARPFSTVKTILQDWFKVGEYIIDPFAGSDTTGVACRQLRLKYDGCEIDPKMFYFGIERNRQLYLFEDEKHLEKKEK